MFIHGEEQRTGTAVSVTYFIIPLNYVRQAKKHHKIVSIVKVQFSLPTP